MSQAKTICDDGQTRESAMAEHEPPRRHETGFLPRVREAPATHRLVEHHGRPRGPWSVQEHTPGAAALAASPGAGAGGGCARVSGGGRRRRPPLARKGAGERAAPSAIGPAAPQQPRGWSVRADTRGPRAPRGPPRCRSWLQLLLVRRLVFLRVTLPRLRRARCESRGGGRASRRTRGQKAARWATSR